MIESIGLRDFRGIRLGKVEGLTSLNVLIGPNNSGKTALLEAMYLGCAVGVRVYVKSPGWGLSAEGHVAGPDFLGEQPMSRVWTKHLHPIRHPGGHSVQDDQGSETVRQRSIQVDSPKAKLRRPLLLQPDPAYPDWPEDVAEQTALCALDINVAVRDAQTRQVITKAWGLELPETACRTVYFWDRPLTYRSRGDAAWYLTGKMPTAAHTFFYDAQKTLQHIPTEFYNRMLDAGVKGWPQKIAERVGRVLGIAEPFQILFVQPGPQQHEWVQGRIVPADSPSLPIDDFGDGARAAFKVLAPLIALSELVTDDEPGVFFWEEPELFQNPLTLGRLLTEVADLAQQKPLQVFLATHSMEVVAKLVGLVRTGQLPEDKLRTLRTFLHQGEFSATPFSTEDLERLSNMGFDPRVPDGDAGSPLRFRLAPDPEAPPLAEAGDE